jgi:molybdate transport system regulatory protein
MQISVSVKIRSGQGEAVLGNGAAFLLDGIVRTGSIRAAAAELNMSYSKAWRIIRLLEGALGVPVLVRCKGGNLHGGAALTPLGTRVLAAYTVMRDDVAAYATRRHRTAMRRLFTGRRNAHA